MNTTAPLLPDFLIIPTRVALDADLQTLDGYVYAVIYWYAKLKLERCTASNKTIANILNCSPSGVANALPRLSKKGFIKIVMDDKNHRIEIIPLISFAPPSSNEEPPLLNPVTPPYSNEDQNKNNIKRIIKEKSNTYPPTPQKTERSSWSTCPVKLNLFSLREKYPEQKDPHDECNEYLRSVENARKKGFADYNSQMFKLHDLLKAGYDFDDINRFVIAVEKKFGRFNWDFERLVKWADKEPPLPAKVKRSAPMFDDEEGVVYLPNYAETS